MTGLRQLTHCDGWCMGHKASSRLRKPVPGDQLEKSPLPDTIPNLFWVSNKSRLTDLQCSSSDTTLDRARANKSSSAEQALPKTYLLICCISLILLLCLRLVLPTTASRLKGVPCFIHDRVHGIKRVHPATGSGDP